MNKEEKTLNSGELYEAIGVDQLLMYSAKRILNNSEECTLERLVYECFTLFPKKFALSRYPQWPDSTRVYRSWRRCILDNKWLKGSPKEGFKLTSEGDKVADAVGTKLKDPGIAMVRNRVSTKARGKEEVIVRYLRKSQAFGRWVQDKNSFLVSESELRSILNATLESPEDILSDNMQYYRENANMVRDLELVEFLDVCYKQHEEIFRRK